MKIMLVVTCRKIHHGDANQETMGGLKFSMAILVYQRVKKHIQNGIRYLSALVSTLIFSLAAAGYDDILKQNTHSEHDKHHKSKNAN